VDAPFTEAAMFRNGFDTFETASTLVCATGDVTQDPELERVESGVVKS